MNRIEESGGKEEAGAGAKSSASRNADVAEDPGCAGGTCRCSRCSLYRWYPPLLVVSTLMAGVFCALYLTKPVHLVRPADTPVPERPEAPAGVPVSDPSAPVGDPGYGEMADTRNERLDPMLGGLPGSGRKEGGLQLATRGPVVMGGPGEGLEPLRVNGPREGLFVPGRPDGRVAPSEPMREVVEVAVVEAAVPEEIVDSGHGRLEVEAPPAAPSAFVTEMALEVDQSPQRSLLMTEAEPGSDNGLEFALGLQPSGGVAEGEVEAHQPPASIIGEFYQERVHQDGPSPGEPAGERI